MQKINHGRIFLTREVYNAGFLPMIQVSIELYVLTDVHCCSEHLNHQ